MAFMGLETQASLQVRQMRLSNPVEIHVIVPGLLTVYLFPISMLHSYFDDVNPICLKHRMPSRETWTRSGSGTLEKVVQQDQMRGPASVLVHHPESIQSGG